MYSGIVIGGPLHGDRLVNDARYFAVAEAPALPPVNATLDAVDTTATVKRHVYIHHSISWGIADYGVWMHERIHDPVAHLISLALESKRKKKKEAR